MSRARKIWKWTAALAGGVLVLLAIAIGAFRIWLENSPELPAEIVLGLGMGAVFVPAFSTATQGVGPRDAGLASAVAGTAQQIGASVGTALLNTIAAAATASYLAAEPHASLAAALVHGYGRAAEWAAAILVAAAVAVGLLVTAGPPDQHESATADRRS